jgi:hypothetical protein
MSERDDELTTLTDDEITTEGGSGPFSELADTDDEDADTDDQDADADDADQDADADDPGA